MSKVCEKVFAMFVVLLCIGLAGRASSAQVDKWGAWKNGITESWWMSSNTFTNDDMTKAIARWKLTGTVSSPGWEGDYFPDTFINDLRLWIE